MAWCHQAASHYLSQRWPDSWNAASLGHIGLIPSQWFGILEDIWNHRCKPVSYMLTDMHIRIRTIIVSNMIWNTCTTGHSITLWVKRSEFKHRCVFAGVHIHTYIHTYIHKHTYIYMHTNKLSLWSGVHALQGLNITLWVEKIEIWHKNIRVLWIFTGHQLNHNIGLNIYLSHYCC